MSIRPLPGVSNQALRQAYGADQASGAKPPDSSFGRLLGDLVKGADAAGDQAEEVTRRMLAGEVSDVHEVMIAQEEAGLAFTLMVEIRNKLVEAYDELMRVQV